MPVLLVILTVSLVLSLVYIAGIRKAYLALNDEQSKLIQQAMESERRAARSETECTYMKLTLNNVLQRPAVAMVGEDVAQQFVAMVESVVKPERMN